MANRYIDERGRLREWVVRANREYDRKLRAGIICDTCGRPFSVAVPRASNPKHKGACEGCSASFD